MRRKKTLPLTRIKCLVVHLPYWEQIMLGEKTIEYRSWPTNHRGIMAIAAAKRKESGESAGRAVCTVNLVDVRKAGEKEFEWMLDDPRPIYPVRINGRLGLFDIDISLDYDVQILVRDDDQAR
jgi:hypothetical protein